MIRNDLNLFTSYQQYTRKNCGQLDKKHQSKLENKSNLHVDSFSVDNILEALNKIVDKSSENCEEKTLKQAKKDYYDEMLTGLTEDELKKIREEIDKFREKAKDGKVDQKALESFVSGLLKQYGYKGDADEMAKVLSGEVKSMSNENSDVNSNMQDDSNKNNDYSMNKIHSTKLYRAKIDEYRTLITQMA